MIYLLVGYMWLFIHRPFEVWPWLGDLHVERVYMLATIGYWALVANKSWTSNCVNIAIALMAASIILSTLFSPYTDFSNETVQNWFKLAIFYILVMSSVRTERELKILVVAFVAILGIYELHALREYMNGRGVYRMDTWRMVGVDATMNDPNTFAASVVYGLPILMFLWPDCRTRKKRIAWGAAFVLAATCVLLTGSRTALAGLCVLVAGMTLLSRHRFTLAMLLLIIAPIAWLALPVDRQNRFLTLIDPSFGPKNAQESAEGRSEGFWNGVALWQKNPIVGVGPAFGIATGKGFQSHHLYGQVLGELGTVGAIAFACLVGSFGLNYLDVRRLTRQNPLLRGSFSARVILAGTTGVLMLLFFGFGGHNLYRYNWLWFGAFEAIALYCLRHREEMPANESFLVADDTMPGDCL